MHHRTPPSRCELCVPTIRRTEDGSTEFAHETACPNHPHHTEAL